MLIKSSIYLNPIFIFSFELVHFFRNKLTSILMSPLHPQQRQQQQFYPPPPRFL